MYSLRKLLTELYICTLQAQLYSCCEGVAFCFTDTQTPTKERHAASMVLHKELLNTTSGFMAVAVSWLHIFCLPGCAGHLLGFDYSSGYRIVARAD